MIAIVCILRLVEIEWGVAMLIKDFHHVFSVDEYPAAARCFFRLVFGVFIERFFSVFMTFGFFTLSMFLLTPGWLPKTE